MSPLRPASRSRGYSLIELMIVVAIIAVMALASAPWFFKIMQRNTMKSAAQEMSITFAAARMRAVKRNLPAEVRVTIASGSQSFHLLETFEMVQPIALKVADGGERCRDGVVLDLLRQMGSLAGEELAELAPFYRPVVTNARGLVVGEVVPDLELEEVGGGGADC